MDTFSLTEFQERIHYCFRDASLLEQAITHRSYAHETLSEKIADNERMEFLGDAVLGFWVSDMLIRSHGDFTEGQLSRKRASLVNERSLASLARAIGLGDYLRLGKGEEHSGGRDKSSILADALEAVVGAVYLDGGLIRLDEWFRNFFMPLLEKQPQETHHGDFKTVLQQIAQKQFQEIPVYLLSGESGPDHCKQFSVIMTIGGIRTEGTGRTKKEAEQEAARKALVLLETDLT
ncbi:MAG: ribonuclease III [Syntrophobacterales bacterium]|jgi:ribonuclease III|nr:ribonuclease III [Syntrophobacterales bacterium]